MTKVLLIGRGQVGNALAELLTNVDLHQWNGRMEEIASDVLLQLAPKVVINAAGKTDLAWCEARAREAFATNVEAPIELYKTILHNNEVSESSTRFIHFSSGCIWDGPFNEQGKPFEPNAVPSPTSYYAWTKAAADALLLSIDPTNVAILRPRQVFSSSTSPRNTLMKLIKYPGLIDTSNSMSSVDIIAKTVSYLLEGSDWAGVWNIYDQGYTTPYAIGMMLAEAGLRDTPQRIEKSELDQWHKPRRVDTVIHDARFERLLQPESLSTVLQRTIALLAASPVTVA